MFTEKFLIYNHTTHDASKSISHGCGWIFSSFYDILDCEEEVDTDMAVSAALEEELFERSHSKLSIGLPFIVKRVTNRFKLQWVLMTKLE